MARNQEGTNPFYILLVIAGVAFTVTACAYGVMISRRCIRRLRLRVRRSGENLLTFYEQVWRVVAGRGSYCCWP